MFNRPPLSSLRVTLRESLHSGASPPLLNTGLGLERSARPSGSLWKDARIVVEGLHPATPRKNGSD